MVGHVLVTVALNVVMSAKPVMAIVPLIECAQNKPLDVVFLVDASGSVKQEGLDSMHKFILQVAMRLNVGTGPTSDRVAVAHFSTDPTETIGFKEGTQLPAIDAHLAKAPSSVGGTNLAKALAFVRENILKFARAAQDAKRVLIVLTDGGADDKEYLAGAAGKIRNDDVLITVVNIKNGNDDELLTMVGGNADLVRKVEDFSDLSALVAPCTTTATTSTTTSTYTTTTVTQTITTTSTTTATTTTSTTSTSTATTITSTTTTTIFTVATPYRLMALCATALGLVCMFMCMVISCSQQIAQWKQQRKQACDDDVESFLPKE